MGYGVGRASRPLWPELGVWSPGGLSPAAQWTPTVCGDTDSLQSHVHRAQRHRVLAQTSQARWEYTHTLHTPSPIGLF